MTQDFSPITPPPELFKQWEDDILNERDNVDHVLDRAWRYGFQAGADQELEACCEWLWKENYTGIDCDLRAHRRPKLPSLKEQALEALDQADKGLNESEWQQRSDIIRRALEQLDD